MLHGGKVHSIIRFDPARDAPDERFCDLLPVLESSAIFLLTLEM